VIAHRLSTIQKCDKILVMLYQLQYKDQEIAVPGE